MFSEKCGRSKPGRIGNRWITVSFLTASGKKRELSMALLTVKPETFPNRSAPGPRLGFGKATACSISVLIRTGACKKASVCAVAPPEFSTCFQHIKYKRS